jgi:putative acetyltransferase
MDIRLAGPGDDIVVAALVSEYAAAFAYELGDQDVVGEGRNARDYYDAGGLIVAEDDGHVIGCVAFEQWGEGRCRMKRMYVLEDSRGKGVGRALADACLKEARKAGYKVMVLDTTAGMTEARALYTSIGFENWTPDYEAPCNDGVYMRQEL